MAPALPLGDEAQKKGNSGNGGQTPLRGNKRSLYNEIVPRKRLTALVVDDVRTCRMLQQAYLLSLGVDAQAVENGSDAVELIASGAKFDLIVIEMILPILNGIEATRQIRAMGVRSKIVGVSACDYEREVQAFLDAGADVFIEKPVFPEHLIPILRELNGQ